MTGSSGAPSLGAEASAAVAVLERVLSLPDSAAERESRPTVVRLEPGQRAGFVAACERHGIRAIDEIHRQLDDLAAARLPGGSREERSALVASLIEAAGGPEAVGNWILLPWDRKAVHLLPADDYFEVITDRNRDKITRAEQALLRTKTIGVMGLSLGGEAAVAVAQEHLCGRLVLADFDRLDLSNLNRLGAGTDDLGVRKTTIAARRIAKLNPYLEVTVLEEGVTADNASSFLDGLDLLIEECDGLRAKYEVRVLARERGLNIVFAGDERGFLSVEPYARHASLPPFHGRIDGPQPPREAFPSTRAFMVALTEWLGGWDRLSDRTRASLERIGATHCGYPQLASEARFAAGQIGHVARRLLLGEDVAPFLGHIDVDELVPAARPPVGR